VRALAAIIAATALAGCNSEPKDEPGEEQAIRAWSKAVNAERYRLAASFFAKDAIVEQGREFVLRDRDAAVFFNSSLPCKADVTDVDDEGETLLAAFRLRRGPGGGCSGSARVRFRFKGGKFSEWRQLPERDTPPGEVL
jgi:hypothetical protein